MIMVSQLGELIVCAQLQGGHVPVDGRHAREVLEKLLNSIIQTHIHDPNSMNLHLPEQAAPHQLHQQIAISPS
jgi:hypothetical protein